MQKRKGRVQGKIIFWLVVFLLLTPVWYFAWQASQPMSMPEFGGRSYYTLLAERRQAYADLAQSYQAGHPNTEVKEGICFFSEVSIQLITELPTAGFYTLAGMFPVLQSRVNPTDLENGYVPDSITLLSFMPSWWDVFEKFVLGTIEYTPHGPVPYCRIEIPR